MKKFMFYTTDGFTQDADGKDIENCQILGWGNGNDEKSALMDFNQNHSYLKEYNFKDISVVEIVSEITAY